MENQKLEITCTPKNSLSKYLIAVFIIFSSMLVGASPVVVQAPVVKNIVIVHGAFADGSGWKAVYTILEKKGYHVTIVQNPLTSLDDDVEATKRILDQQDGPVILVGHSWAGTVITQAGVDPKVVALVYVAAFQPDKGETSNQWAVTQPADPSMRVTAPDKKGAVFFNRETFHAGYCADLSQATADFMNASQQPIVGQCFATPVTEAAWKDKPSYGIVATDDKAINPDIERNMYKRANDKIIEIKGSHAVFISNPEAVAQVIISASFTSSPYTSFSRNVIGLDTITDVTKPALPPNGFSNQYAMIHGVKLHYVIGGHGTPLMLVHGFPQNWYMWNRLLPELSKHFTVIAPDLRGVGESDKPEGGYDKKNMAIDLHELAKKLGYKKIDIAGHDVGMMVAYAYAAQFPDEVNKLALLDALIAGIEPVWSEVKAQAWWFGFFSQPHSAEVAEGRMNLILQDFLPMLSFVKDSFTPQEEAEFIRAYSVKGAARASFLSFVFEQDIKDNQEFRKNKLTMPVLAMGSDHFAPFLSEHVRLLASNVKECMITGSGHWIVQEQTGQVQKGLLEFFIEN